MAWNSTEEYRNRIPWTPTLTCWNGSTHTTIPYPQDSVKSFYTYRQGIVNAQVTFNGWTPGSDPVWALNDGQEWRLTAPRACKSQSGFSHKLIGTANGSWFNGGGWAFDMHYEFATGRIKFLFSDGYRLEILKNSNKNTMLGAFFGGYGVWEVQLRYEAVT